MRHSRQSDVMGGSALPDSSPAAEADSTDLASRWALVGELLPSERLHLALMSTTSRHRVSDNVRSAMRRPGCSSALSSFRPQPTGLPTTSPMCCSAISVAHAVVPWPRRSPPALGVTGT